jgi:hypothetical protein
MQRIEVAFKVRKATQVGVQNKQREQDRRFKPNNAFAAPE